MSGKDNEAPAKDNEAPAEAPAKDNEAPAKDNEAPAKDNEAPAKDNEAPAKDKKDPAKDENDPAKDKEDPSLVFHYTSKDGITGIVESGKIDASVAGNDDVFFGDNKVYMTSLHPEKNTPLEIAKNNYDGSDDYVKSKLPRTEYAIGYNAKEIQAAREDCDRSIQTVKGDVPFEKAQVLYQQKGDGYERVWSKPEEKLSHD